MYKEMDPEKRKKLGKSVLSELIKQMAMADAKGDEDHCDNTMVIAESDEGDKSEVNDAPMSDDGDSEMNDGESLSAESIALLLKSKNEIPKKDGVAFSFSKGSGFSKGKSKGRPKGSRAKY